MKRQRTPQPPTKDPRAVRKQAGGADEETPAIAHDASSDDLEGQLGPDELPDASEVVMNREAKRHRG
jgi:hypothetical protein